MIDYSGVFGKKGNDVLLYQSMTAIALLTSINVVLLLWIGTQRNPVYVFLGIARELFSSMRYLLLLAALVSIFLLNYLEQQLEALLVASRLDFTPWVFQLEGRLFNRFSISFMLPG